MILFAKAEEASLCAGILGGWVWGSGAKVEGFVEDFFGEDSRCGCRGVRSGQESVSNVRRYYRGVHCLTSTASFIFLYEVPKLQEFCFKLHVPERDDPSQIGYLILALD